MSETFAVMCWKMLVFFFGASMASFAGVFAERYPANRSLMTRSSCDSCGAILQALDLVPVLSWVFLRGKCRRCSASIPVSYFLMELFLGCVALLLDATWFLPMTFFGIFSLFTAIATAGLFLSISLIDLKTMDVYDTPSIAAILLAILAVVSGQISLGSVTEVIFSWRVLANALMPGILGAAFMFLLWYGTAKQGFGDGDIMPASALCILLGYPFAILDLFVFAPFVGISLVLGKVFLRMKKGETFRNAYLECRKFPFVPALFLGWILLMLYLHCGFTWLPSNGIKLFFPENFFRF